jgi:Na+/glutamate symporter
MIGYIMKKWIPKILAYIIMLPIILVGIVGGIIWNTILIIDYIYRDIRRKYKKEIQQINREEHK